MKNIFKIISFTKHLRKWYLFMGIFVVLISFLSLVIPILSKMIVDLIVDQIGGKKVDFNLFIYLLLGIIITDIFITIMTTFSQWIGDILTVRLQTYLTKKYYEQVLSLHISYFDNEITGRIVNKMYRGIASITDFIQSMLNNFLPFFLTAIVTIILLGKYSFFIALLLAILFPVYILISHGSTVAWGKFEEQKNKLNDTVQGRVFESISGIRIVKSFASELIELKSFLRHRKNIEDLTVDQTREWHVYDFIRRLSLNIILFAIFSYIVYWTFHKRYTLGEMTLLLQLVNQARFPLFAMSFILGQIQQASSGSEDFFQVLGIKNEIEDRNDAKALKINERLGKNNPMVEFQRVSFNYDNQKNVLKDVSFVIYPGEKLALVGESGQGKSTIVSLLLRYYEPQKGSVVISGKDICHITQKSLHENIAVVFQESLLFSGTIRENIGYGKIGAGDKEITEASIAANAYEFIMDLPNKFDTVIGERGVKLSGGQKQRIAIARAILKDAPIIILDEATSSLDSKAEVAVQKGLDRLLTNKTSIIIAHRLSTLASVDHILVIAAGRVAQYGKASELIRDKKGLYAQLVELQHQLLTAPSELKKKKLEQFDLIG